MTKSTLHRLLVAAQECTDLDEYISETGGSLPVDYYSADGDADDAVELLGLLWSLSRNLNFRDLRKLSELSQRAFSAEYGIPTRTVEDWDAGRREPPPYILEFILCDILNQKIEERDGGKTK